MPDLRLVNLSRRYGNQFAVADLNLTVHDGEMVSLLGPSGCGKTTTLRMIAGLLKPTSGSIYLGDKEISRIPPHRRNLGLVFQNYALFPHMSVFENVAFGLRRRRAPEAEVKARVEEALGLVQMSDYGQRLPSQLSGGQQQRVALARVLVLRPPLVLFDEPLSNLDAKLRDAVRIEIRALQKRLGFTAVFVTHDQEEAMVLSDRVAIMEQGRLVQIGTPWDVYHRPQTSFVAEFIGASNLIEGRVARPIGGEERVVLPGRQSISCVAGRSEGEVVRVLVRPEAVTLTPVTAEDTEAVLSDSSTNSLRGTVSFVHFLGADFLIGLDVPGFERPFLARCGSQPAATPVVREGEEAVASWPVTSTLVF